MPDAFLKRVIAQRAREQGIPSGLFGADDAEALDARLAEADARRWEVLDAIPNTRRCPYCGKKNSEATVLAGFICSGTNCRRRAKRAAQAEAAERAERERQAAVVAQQVTRRRALLALVGLTRTSEDAMSAEDMKCSRCGRQLRSRNGEVKDPCFRCRLGADRKSDDADAEAPARRGGPKTKSPVRKRFYELAELVGQDADALLEEFMAGWVDRIVEGARAAVEREAA